MLAPAGSARPNPFGLYDMLGNVWEWTAVCWNGNGSVETAGDRSRRVVRGGSWEDNPSFVRAGYRNWNVTGIRNSVTGFRVARTLL
nr:SUMF1/EgtB/PvdO family nonheme iron enzyme [uncultured Rhodopila sp.]